jgi:hypothetical protein
MHDHRRRVAVLHGRADPVPRPQRSVRTGDRPTLPRTWRGERARANRDADNCPLYDGYRGRGNDRDLVASLTSADVAGLPLLIDSLYRPEVLHQGDRRFDEVVQFMDWSSEDFNHKFTVEGDEVVVDG